MHSHDYGFGENASVEAERLRGHDGWVADGTIGDPEQPNAADLQLASTIRLMLTLGDARPLIEGRPCGDLARALFPQVDSELPAGSLTAS
jgi:hypothetical protein